MDEVKKFEEKRQELADEGNEDLERGKLMLKESEHQRTEAGLRRTIAEQRGKIGSLKREHSYDMSRLRRARQDAAVLRSVVSLISNGSVLKPEYRNIQYALNNLTREAGWSENGCLGMDYGPWFPELVPKTNLEKYYQIVYDAIQGTD